MVLTVTVICGKGRWLLLFYEVRAGGLLCLFSHPVRGEGTTLADSLLHLDLVFCLLDTEASTETLGRQLLVFIKALLGVV